MCPPVEAFAVLGIYPSRAHALAARASLEEAGLDGHRISIVTFAAHCAAKTPDQTPRYFVLATGNREVLTHARIVLASSPMADGERPRSVSPSSSGLHASTLLH